MTRSRYRVLRDCHPHFLTCTIVGWLPVFTRRETTEIIYESWRFMQQQREFKLFGYVILENHLHMIASAPNLDAVMKDFKSYTARRIIDLLEQRSATVLLEQLEYHKLRHKTQSDYQVWQEGSHPQEIQDDAMMWQKLEYAHNNPLERGYVDDPIHWRYSSARNYAKMLGLIEVVTDWM